MTICLDDRLSSCYQETGMDMQAQESLIILQYLSTMWMQYLHETLYFHIYTLIFLFYCHLNVSLHLNISSWSIYLYILYSCGAVLQCMLNIAVFRRYGFQSPDLIKYQYIEILNKGSYRIFIIEDTYPYFSHINIAEYTRNSHKLFSMFLTNIML